MIENALNTKIIDQNKPLSSGVYIFGAFEERSTHFSSDAYKNLTFLELNEDQTGAEINVADSGKKYAKNVAGIKEIISTIKEEYIYLDITGLSHSVWAPFVKSLLEEKKKFSVVYVEPLDYRKVSNTNSGEMYDLGDEIKGISPIPGFATFLEEEEDFIFVPLLGFEGARFSFMLDNVQPLRRNIFPVIGVPGFRLEYPFNTYEGNRFPLIDSSSWQNVIYTSADCPFSLYYELEKLHQKYPKAGLKIALIGTKPHALGAILFRLAHSSITEIVYDHPIRTKQRTKGASKEHLYDVSSFFESVKVSSNQDSTGRLR